MARIKIIDKKAEPDWLIQRRAKKQGKYDKKAKQVKHRKPTINPSLGNLWPETYDEREDI